MGEPSKRRLGEVLVERGFVSPETLREALRVQPQHGKRLGEILLEMGALTADELNWALSELLGVPYVEFRDEMVDLTLARSLPEDLLRRHQAVPVLQVGEELTVILADPLNRHAVVELEAVTGRRIQVAIAARETIAHLLDKAFPPTPRRGPGVRYADVGAGPAPPQADPTGVAQVYALLLGALREDATEVHVEPLGADVRVRHRVDGRLVERSRFPSAELGAVVSRLRILAGLRGASGPREALVRTRLEQQEVELQLLFFPTLSGEAVTIRVSPRGGAPPALDAFEVDGAGGDALPRLAARPGLVVVTGWDARARAALLYALARAGAVPGTKVVTVERGAGFQVADFLQVEAPADFAEAVATILTQPADVALIEDLAADGVCRAALGAAEHGGLVLAGLAAGGNAAALARLLSLDAPRLPLLGAVSGLATVRRQGTQYRASVLDMTVELRRELTRQGPWTSRIS
jgi:type IV pilus assembly protein PilB